MLFYFIFRSDAQALCGFATAGRHCAAGVCLEKMAAHYAEAHEATLCRGRFAAKVLDDGSKRVQIVRSVEFPENGEGWFAQYAGLTPYVFRTAVGGGCFAFDLQKTGPGELRFGVRQLGRGPSRHRLASVTVRFGPAEGTCVQFALSRALAADERLGDDALCECAGTPPAVERVDAALLSRFLRPALAPSDSEAPWELAIAVSLVLQVV